MINKIHNQVTEIEKVEAIIKDCIDRLYEENTNKNTVAYVLENAKDKLSVIKKELDRIYYPEDEKMLAKKIDLDKV